MKNFSFGLFGMILLVGFACNRSNLKKDSLTYSEFQKKGNEITKLAQATLLSNVGMAIQQGGTEYAVEFCNLKASPIIDSLNQVNNCVISRVSDKNRNLQNHLNGDLEKELWEIFKTHALKDTLVKSGKHLVYYKPIKTAMPACLKCHGTPGVEIEALTLTKIQKLYPEDLATGYQLNDFRGLWKVEFSK